MCVSGCLSVFESDNVGSDFATLRGGSVILRAGDLGREWISFFIYFSMCSRHCIL